MKDVIGYQDINKTLSYFVQSTLPGNYFNFYRSYFSKIYNKKYIFLKALNLNFFLQI